MQKKNPKQRKYSNCQYSTLKDPQKTRRHNPQDQESLALWRQIIKK